MSWRAITEDDILGSISGDELDALRSAALADGQEDPIAGAIASITETIRGYVSACTRNTLGAAGTIPERLMNAAVDILVVQISSRAAGTLIDPNGIRAKAADAATTLLEQVAACKFMVDVPDSGTASTEQTASPTPSIHHKHRRFRRRDQEGI